MANESTGHINCESCGQAYPWRTEFAGKKVRCQCGHMFTFPDTDPAELKVGLSDPFEVVELPQAPKLADTPAPEPAGDYEITDK